MNSADRARFDSAGGDIYSARDGYFGKDYTGATDRESFSYSAGAAYREAERARERGLDPKPSEDAFRRSLDALKPKPKSDAALPQKHIPPGMPPNSVKHSLEVVIGCLCCEPFEKRTDSFGISLTEADSEQYGFSKGVAAAISKQHGVNINSGTSVECPGDNSEHKCFAVIIRFSWHVGKVPKKDPIAGGVMGFTDEVRSPAVPRWKTVEVPCDQDGDCVLPPPGDWKTINTTNYYKRTP